MARTGSWGAATSSDGRRFTAVLTEEQVVPGDLVVIGGPDGARPSVGQVTAKRGSGDGHIGEGAILGTLSADGTMAAAEVRPFGERPLDPAGRDVWDALERSRHADMRVGSSGAGGVLLSSGSFNRHTFMCGQSGSGKSYALGVLLEQLLVDTDLPMVVLDPNGDYVGLGDLVPEVDDDERARLSEADVRVFRAAGAGADRPLLVRFNELSLEAKAAVLRLDPLADRAEYNLLLEMRERMRTEPPDVIIRELMESGEHEEQLLAQRIQNLAVLEWDVWAMGARGVLDDLDPLPRAAVLDLAGFTHPREPLAAVLALLEWLWARREQRQPLLLVVDEAHNVCTPHTSDPLAVATTELLVQIANEGRKYGIWLLLCTQRPSRIHPSVLAQCDNLVLMRMNSPGDLDELERYFAFVPPEMLRVAPLFRQGESLMAGTFVPVPTFARVRARRTRQGGSDVRVPQRSG